MPVGANGSFGWHIGSFGLRSFSQKNTHKNPTCFNLFSAGEIPPPLKCTKKIVKGFSTVYVSTEYVHEKAPNSSRNANLPAKPPSRMFPSPRGANTSETRLGRRSWQPPIPPGLEIFPKQPWRPSMSRTRLAARSLWITRELGYRSPPWRGTGDRKSVV